MFVGLRLRTRTSDDGKRHPANAGELRHGFRVVIPRFLRPVGDFQGWSERAGRVPPVNGGTVISEGFGNLLRGQERACHAAHLAPAAASLQGPFRCRLRVI